MMAWPRGKEQDFPGYETPVSRMTSKQQNHYAKPVDVSEDAVHYKEIVEPEYSCVEDEKPTLGNVGTYLETGTPNADLYELIAESQPRGRRQGCSRVVVWVLIVMCLLLATSTCLLASWYAKCLTENSTDKAAVLPTDGAKLYDRPTSGAATVGSSYAASEGGENPTPEGAESEDEVCGEEFVASNTSNVCYFVSDAEVTKAEAAQQCADKSSRLLSPNVRDHELAGLLANTPAVSNLAVGSSCSASSEWSADYDCEKAIDGSTTPVASVWVIRGDSSAVGSWIEINLGAVSEVNEIQILTRCYRSYQIKGFQLQFSDRSTHEGQLTCANGGTREDCGGVSWQTYKVTPRVTSYVKIEITSVCIARYNGFREVKVKGRPVSGYWTDGVRAGTTWQSGGIAVRGTLNWDQQVSTTGSSPSGSCLCLSRRGYVPCTCNALQSRRFVCVKDKAT